MTFSLTPAQQHRGQINGGAARRKNKPTVQPFTKRTGLIPNCPQCFVRYSVYRTKSLREGFDNWRCKYCTTTFYLRPGEDNERPNQKACAHSGSGVIAPLTYRQQMVRDILAKNEADRKRAVR